MDSNEQQYYKVQSSEEVKVEKVPTMPAPIPIQKAGKNESNCTKNILFRFLKKASVLLLGYLICYLNLSITLPIILIATYVCYESTTSKQTKKIFAKSKASSISKDSLLNIIDEIPSWVMFPDRERAEWLNEIILQLWPSLSIYIIKLCRTSIQNKIRKKFDSFRFEEIDFGKTPPKIDGVKVYNRSLTKDAIIIDFDLYYDGECDIHFSLKGAQIGRIRDFQLGGELRVVLKPLLVKVPIVGGVQVFFLNTPEINFDLEGLSGIPGLSYFLRQKIEERFTKKLVYPNKITKRFSKSVEAAELKALEPEGVLRVHVFEAKDLERKDVTGKSDPYVVLNIGAQKYKTHVLKRDLNPKWDCWFEFIILDPIAQHLQFLIFDEDDLNEDDFLGSGIVEVCNVIKENDQWFELEHARHGKIHLRFTWLGLSSDLSSLKSAIHETKVLKVAELSTALLTVYLDSALNLTKLSAHKKPTPYARLSVGKLEHTSKRKRHTTDPSWEEGFSLLLVNPETDVLTINIFDKESEHKLDYFTYKVNDLFTKPDLQFSKQEFPLSVSGKIMISLQLRILTDASFECNDNSSESEDDDAFIRRHSTRSSNRSNKSSPSSALNSNQNSPKILQNFSYFPTPSEEPDVLAEKSVLGVTSGIKVSKGYSKEKTELGQIELSIFYNDRRQKLMITVHKITNLPLKDRSSIPDPYVKLKLLAPGTSPVKNKTKVVIDNCHPIYEDTFEFLVSNLDLPKTNLVLTVKNKKHFFNSNVMGQVTLNLKNFDELHEPYREWFELVEERESD